MICTFFGHRDCPESIKPKLKAKIVQLIENENISEFYTGNNGNFDFFVQQILFELRNQYNHIDPIIVLSHPDKLANAPLPSLFPEKLDENKKALGRYQRQIKNKTKTNPVSRFDSDHLGF